MLWNPLTLYFWIAYNISQTIDVILAWLVAEDDGAKSKISSLLADRDEDLSLIRATLQGKQLSCTLSSITSGLTYFTEQMSDLGDEDTGQKDLKEMLATLMQFL